MTSPMLARTRVHPSALARSRLPERRDVSIGRSRGSMPDQRRSLQRPPVCRSMPGPCRLPSSGELARHMMRGRTWAMISSMSPRWSCQVGFDGGISISKSTHGGTSSMGWSSGPAKVRIDLELAHHRAHQPIVGLSAGTPRPWTEKAPASQAHRRTCCPDDMAGVSVATGAEGRAVQSEPHPRPDDHSPAQRVGEGFAPILPEAGPSPKGPATREPSPARPPPSERAAAEAAAKANGAPVRA